jgi:hypothetical protein
MAGRKNLSLHRVRPHVEALEERLAPDNLLSAVSLILPFDDWTCWDSGDAASYQLVSSAAQPDVALATADEPLENVAFLEGVDQVFSSVDSQSEGLTECSFFAPALDDPMVQ